MMYQTFVDLLKDQRYSNPQVMVNTAIIICSLNEKRWEFLQTVAIGIAFRLVPTDIQMISWVMTTTRH